MTHNLTKPEEQGFCEVMSRIRLFFPRYFQNRPVVSFLLGKVNTFELIYKNVNV
jgi:hypothetical protein